MPTTPNNTAGQSLLAWADTSSGGQRISSAVDVSAKVRVLFFFQIARRSGSAFSTGWPTWRVEASPDASGTSWFPAPAGGFGLGPGASLVNTTLNGAVTAGDSTCVVTANTNIAAGDVLYLGHTTTITNSELVRVKSVSGTTVTFEEACVNNHDSGAAVTDQADKGVVPVDCLGIQRLRAVFDNAGSGQTAAGQASYSSCDSFGT